MREAKSSKMASAVEAKLGFLSPRLTGADECGQTMAFAEDHSAFGGFLSGQCSPSDST